MEDKTVEPEHEIEIDLKKLDRRTLHYLMTRMYDISSLYYSYFDRPTMGLSTEPKDYLEEIIKLLKNYDIIQ